MAREVREETGVVARLEGLVSLRHAHARAFGQGDNPNPNPDPNHARAHAPLAEVTTSTRL